MLTSETLNERGAGKLTGHLGIVITEVGETVTATRASEPHHRVPNGYLHAGTVVTLADTVAGDGCIEKLPKGATGFTTIELRSNFLGGTREGALECHGPTGACRAHHAGVVRDSRAPRGRQHDRPVALHAARHPSEMIHAAAVAVGMLRFPTRPEQ